MALDPKIYDVAAYNKAVAKFKKDVAAGKATTGGVQANTFLLPGQKPPPGSGAPDVTGYDPRFGGIPGVPNPVTSAGEAIAGNLANFGDLAKLTGQTNDLTFGQYTGRLPGYSDMASTSSANILAKLRGEIPQDVINLIGQQAAERGIGRGVSGSDFSNTDYLRSLGITSLDLNRQGEADFTGATDRLKGIPLFDPTSMFTKPEDVYGAGLQRNIFSSAPQPGAAAANNLNMAKLPFTNAANTAASDLWNKNRQGGVYGWNAYPGGRS